MEDKETIEVLTEILRTHKLTAREQEALRSSIGILGWTKLVEGWKEQKKKLRDRKLSDTD